ncbi:MAG: hypothetical protein Q4C99_11325 [Clostridia bacterium]|nr:hypothetical protein [Clostridia bacterium]
MKKFNTPEINVVKFMNEDVITTSSNEGYSNNETTGNIGNLFGFATQAASDPTGEIPF